jgi:catechol 2,3-dioxygenase-like lactoylglutathione lyase family enzyme
MRNLGRDRGLLVACALGLAVAAQPAASQGSSPPQARAAASEGGVNLFRAHGARATAPRAHWQMLACREYLLTVSNLDRSLAFYRNVLGLTLIRAPQAPASSRGMERLTNTPGALFRSASLQLPGSDVQLLLAEFTHIARKGQHPHVTDPGAAMLVVPVSDLSTVMQAVRRSGDRVLTAGAQPIDELPEGRSIVLIDPDGFFVRVEQVASKGSAEAGPVRAQLVYTVAEPGPLMRFYGNLAGLRIRSSGFIGGANLERLINAPGAQADAIATDAADGHELLQFVAYRGLMRHTYLSRPQDPGSAAAALTVSDLPAALKALRAAGAPVITAGGQPVDTPNGESAVIVRDSAGILLELIQSSPASR